MFITPHKTPPPPQKKNNENTYSVVYMAYQCPKYIDHFPGASLLLPLSSDI